MAIGAIGSDCGCENPLIVRPLEPGQFGRGEAATSAPGSIQPPTQPHGAPAPRRHAQGEPANGTAHQSNRDGDTVTLFSKLDQLTPEEQAQLDKLKQRDQEVRTHEQAHVSAAGGLFRGGPTYAYQTGPDGRDYAVGGSVQIDTSPGRTPEETIVKAAQMQRAALAPADPSAADRAVAAKAARMQAEAQAEIASKRTEDEPRRPSNSIEAAATPSAFTSPTTSMGEQGVDVYA